MNFSIRIRIRNTQEMALIFDFAYETLLTAARKMDRIRIQDMIEGINEELSYIAEILNFYDDEENEIFQENVTRAQFLLKERALYCQVYQERMEEFQQEIEDEMYEKVKENEVSE